MKPYFELINTSKCFCKSLFFLVLMSHFSCNPEKNSINITDEGNLEVIMNGTEEYITIEDTKKLASNSNNTSPQQLKVVEYDGFDAITSIGIEDPISELKKTKEASLSKTLRKFATTSKLANGVKYRLIIIKNSDNSKVVDHILEITPQTTVPRMLLQVGQSYKWIAYSINENTVPTIDANNIINRNDIANKDFLYASDNITIQTGYNFLNLTLKRYTTKYDVTVDIRGMFATFHNDTRISLANVNQDLFQTADFNISTGVFDAATYTPIKITGTDLQAIPGEQIDIKKASFHTVITNQIAAEDALKLNFSPLSILMDDNLNRVFPTASVKLTHAALTGTSTRGRKYNIKAQLVESPISVAGDATETKWARSNLWYDATKVTTTGAYRFRVSPHQRDLVNRNGQNLILDPNDLWRFNTKIPNDATQTAGYDPCTDVHPKNLWKTPSSNNFQSLPNTGINSYVVNRNDFYDGIFLNIIILGRVNVATSYRMELMTRWTKSSTSIANSTYESPYQTNPLETNSSMNDLFLSGVGYKNTSDVITDRPTYLKVLDASLLGDILGAGLLTGFSGNGFYWTSDGNTVDSPVSTPSYYTFSNNNSSVLNLNLTGANLLTLLPVNSIFNSAISTMSWDNAMNIRCVRK